MNIDAGQLGQGHTDNIGDDAGEMGDYLMAIDWGTDFTVSHISCSGWSTCAIDLERGEIKCIGFNSMFSLSDEQALSESFRDLVYEDREELDCRLPLCFTRNSTFFAVEL